MDVIDWLFTDLTISRFFTTQIFYIFMFFFTILSIYISWRYRLFKFSLLIWLSVTIIGLIWEFSLFTSGLRTYSFWSSAELVYHAVTEGGPGLIIIIIFADKIGFIDLSDYKEDVKK